ncbi:CLUMA_CG002515, isoform A, partial [Clunio marinus]
KKKKIRQVSEDDDVEHEFRDLSLDIDYPQSSVDSFKEIDFKELQELSECVKNGETSKVEIKTDNGCDALEIIANDEETADSTEEAQEIEYLPSAPNIEGEQVKDVPSVHTKFLYDKTLYPDLKDVATTSAIQITEKILSPVTVKPFTPLQIEQLYSNRQIQLIEMFEEEFVDKELKDVYAQDHPLFVLLKKFAKSRSKCLLNLRNISHITSKLDKDYKNIWKIEKRYAVGHGSCDCGRPATASHTYDHAVFNEDINSEVNKNMKELLNLSCFNHTKFSQDSELHKRQIEQLIAELMNSKSFNDVPKDSPVALNDEIVYPDMKSKINDLRLYISILFKFFRDKLHDKYLINCVQNWIKKLVALQLRIATWQDHVFILFHVLRCPVGVGSWAAELIQVPVLQRLPDVYQNPFTYPEFQHCIAILSALLLPVKNRGTFLEGITKDLNPTNDDVNEEIWILVDSDGEEGSSPTGECIGLKENDLVAIFDQIPFEMLFCMMTHSHKRNETYELDVEKISGHHIIRTIAFSSKFIGIMKRGLTTYDTERYKQFAKRLGRLMKNTLFYISDIIQLYHTNNCYKDPEEYQRIQVEFDELIIRSTHFIYESQKLSLFQYLAEFPYRHVSTKSLWKLFYYLHVGDFKVIEDDITRRIIDDDFSAKFNDDVATDDLFFLLHAFAQMALAKGKEDFDFIIFITIDLLQIGFINERTRDFCYNTVKDLLTNITTKFPTLIANIFNYLKTNLQKVGNSSSYLFKALPIAMWKPKTEDLEVLASWLLNFDFDSTENATARVIFAVMNWNFDANDKLFLPHEIHVRMAFLVNEVYMKHIGESIGSGVSETARQVGSGKKNPSKKEQFSMWCWSMVSVLRLHFMDLNKQTVMSLIENPAIVNMVPEIETTHGIYQGFTEQKPLSIYISLLMSQVGHSIPQICHRGFDQLKLLLNDYRHSKVIRCLELITPLFVSCQSSLYSCESFMSVLSSLFVADRTYGRLAKEVMTADARGPVLTFFGNMIQHQVINYSRYGWSSPNELIQLWLNCLTRLKEWNKDQGVVWVLDLICQLAYQNPGAWSQTKEILRPFVVKISDTKIPKSSGLLTLLTAEEKDVLVIPSEDAPILSLVLLELEFQSIEMNTGFWSEFLCQLLIQNRTTLPNVLKKTLPAKQLTVFPFQSLVIFKLAKLIMKMSPKHFIFPIVCQQFFTLYMSRVPGNISEEAHGVQDKFYDVDVTLMKKLKKIFSDSENLHIEQATKFTQGLKSQFHTTCAKLFKTFLLWLEETQLNKMTQQRIILPPQYDHPRLKEIFQGNRDHWTEFIFLPDLKQTQKADCNSWLAVCARYTSQSSSSFTAKTDDEDEMKIDQVKEKLFTRLKMIGRPLDPPELVKENVHMGRVDSSKSTLQLLRNESRILQNFAHQFNMMVDEHKAIDCAYRDTVRLAYVNESSIRLKSAICSRLIENCQGSTTIRLEFKEAKLNEHIKGRLDDNRDLQKQMIVKETKSPDPKIVDANFCLQNVIQQLLEQYENSQNRGDDKTCESILKIGTSFFYEILDEINEEIQSCPVTQELYSVSISKLGMFVQQNHDTEGQNLLKLALKRSNLVNLIAELFTPSVSSPKYFLEMYKSLVDSYAKRCEPQLLFVLFSKFDIPKWLQLHKPKLIEISNLIQLVIRGLELWNHQNSDLLQDLLRCHLVSLFLHQFPEHYGEILQSVLNGFSAQRLKPNVLLDLLNGFYQRIGCSKLDPEMSIGRMKDEMRNFGSKQNILSYNDVHSTSLMLAHHFYNERLQYGLHGLYPKFSEHCDVICFLMGSIGHSAVASAIQSFPGIMADQLVNWLWPCLSEMFSPWLIPYYPQTMKDAPANWIQQFTSTNSALQPWSEIHVDNAGKVIRMFAMCLQYVLDMLPASNLLMGHLFCWYDGYFAYKTTPKHVLTPIQTLLMKMPWERFRPDPSHMERLNRILMDFLPDCHLFVGSMFLRIPWTSWLQHSINVWDYQITQRMLSILLMIIVKFSYEPKVRESIRIIQILQESVKYPWHLLEYKEIESVLDWFVLSAEPSVILKIPSEHETIDSCVISLLQVASCMKELPRDCQNLQKTSVTAKRMGYVRSIVRLLKGCDAKLHQLMETKKGQEMFHQACISLFSSIESCVSNGITDEATTMEMTNLLIPIVQNMAIPESTSKLFADSIGLWQTSSQTGNIVLCCMLNALKVQKHWTLRVYQVLESTLFNYMRVSELCPNHTPTWPDALQRFRASQTNFDHNILITNDFFLSLYLLSNVKMQNLSDDNDRVTFLQDLQIKLAEKKSLEVLESKIALLWGFLIISGGHIFKRSEAVKHQLLIIARYFQVNVTQPEGWSDGLLGVIGLRKNDQSNKKKILLRCFSCAIFAIFINDSQISLEYEKAVAELKDALSNKKFNDVRMVGLQALGLIESKKSMLDGFNETISNIIRMFYEEPFLNTMEDLYHW